MSINEDKETNGIRFSPDGEKLIIGRPYYVNAMLPGAQWKRAGDMAFDHLVKILMESPKVKEKVDKDELRLTTFDGLHEAAVRCVRSETNHDPKFQIEIVMEDVPGHLVNYILNDEETHEEVSNKLIRKILQLGDDDHPLEASLRDIEDIYLAMRLLQTFYGDGPNLEVKRAGRWMPIKARVMRRDGWTGRNTTIRGNLIIGDRQEPCAREITGTVFEDDRGISIRRKLAEVLEGISGGWYSDEFRALQTDVDEWQRECQQAITVSVPGAVFNGNGIALAPQKDWYGRENLRNFHVHREMVVAEPEMESEQRRRDPYGEEVEGTPTAFVRIFHLGRKEYVYLHVHDLEEYAWEEDALDNLVLPGHMQDILKAVFDTDPSEMFGDVLQARSGGMVIEACGSTGVGKTLTAEIFAQHNKRPLYVMEIGELGTNLDSIEENLMKIFDRAERWNAVLLLDEADVFLAKRGLDLERSAIVGVFLRLLDYFRGIIFLTTNRSNIIDPAFASRVTIRLDYPYLNTNVRGDVWDILLRKAELNVEASDEGRETLLETPFNGRQIRNIVRLTRIVEGGSKEGGAVNTTYERLLQVGRYQPITEEAIQADASSEPVVGDHEREYVAQ